MITNRKWKPKDHVYGNRWLPKCDQRPYPKFSVKDFQMTNFSAKVSQALVSRLTSSPERGSHLY
jgi:hypothetical protein